MDTLFPVEPVYPPGFVYQPDFISAQEEEELLHLITSSVQLHTFHFQGFEAKRKVASFGYDWSFEKRLLSKGKDIPAAFENIIKKVANHVALPVSAFAELLVTEYPEGSVINWHRDAPPFDLVAGLSLLSDCHFRFRPHEKAKQSRKSVIALTVKRRSLYIIHGASRTDWQHSIDPVKSVRYSITLRTLHS
jgi:alkylated DNA repair dioxygenase AlkB